MDVSLEELRELARLENGGRNRGGGDMNWKFGIRLHFTLGGNRPKRMINFIHLDFQLTGRSFYHTVQ